MKVKLTEADVEHIHGMMSEGTIDHTIAICEELIQDWVDAEGRDKIINQFIYQCERNADNKSKELGNTASTVKS